MAELSPSASRRAGSIVSRNGNTGGLRSKATATAAANREGAGAGPGRQVDPSTIRTDAEFCGTPRRNRRGGAGDLDFIRGRSTGSEIWGPRSADGRWNVSTDGSLDIPVKVIREAALEFGNEALLDAIREIKSESFTQLLGSSSAVLRIDTVGRAYNRYFRETMDRYQNATDPSESARLRDELVRAVFGKEP